MVVALIGQSVPTAWRNMCGWTCKDNEAAALRPSTPRQLGGRVCQYRQNDAFFRELVTVGTPAMLKLSVE
jgi:hypothetical protein